MGFIKGMVTGLAVGAVVTMAMDPVSDRQRRKFQRKTEGLFRTIGTAIDSAVCIFK